MSKVQEQLPYGVLDNHGDVKPDADFRDADGDLIEIPDPIIIEHADEGDEALLAQARKEYDRIIAAQQAWDKHCDAEDGKLPSHDQAVAATERKYGERPEVPSDLLELFGGSAPTKPQTVGRKVIEAYRADYLASQIAGVNATATLNGDRRRGEISRLKALDRSRREKTD